MILSLLTFREVVLIEPLLLILLLVLFKLKDCNKVVDDLGLLLVVLMLLLEPFEANILETDKLDYD